MIRTATPSRALALTAAVGVLALTGCSAAPAPDGSGPGTPQTSGAATPDGAPATDDAAGGTGSYADGSYTAEGSYQTPETIETISVTVTLEDGVVSAVEVSGDPQRPESELYQGEFIGGIADDVVGRPIDEVNVSRIAGSSLTSGGFNDAIEAIKGAAAA